MNGESHIAAEGGFDGGGNGGGDDDDETNDESESEVREELVNLEGGIFAWKVVGVNMTNVRELGVAGFLRLEGE